METDQPNFVLQDTCVSNQAPAVGDRAMNFDNRQSPFDFVQACLPFARHYLGSCRLRVRLVAEFQESYGERQKKATDEDIKYSRQIAQRQFVSRSVLLLAVPAFRSLVPPSFHEFR